VQKLKLELSEEFAVLLRNDVYPSLGSRQGTGGSAAGTRVRWTRIKKGRLARPFSAVSWDTTLSNP
jgi:hypothetical protein